MLCKILIKNFTRYCLDEIYEDTPEKYNLRIGQEYFANIKYNGADAYLLAWEGAHSFIVHLDDYVIMEIL